MDIYLITSFNIQKIIKYIKSYHEKVDSLYYDEKIDEKIFYTLIEQLNIKDSSPYSELNYNDLKKNIIIIGGADFINKIMEEMFEKFNQKSIIEISGENILALEYTDSELKLIELLKVENIKFLENDEEIKKIVQSFNAIMDFASDYIYVKDEHYRFGPVNSNLLKSTGYDHWTEIKGKTDYDIFEKETADRFREDDRAVIEDGTIITDRIEPYHKEDGTIGWLKTTKRPIRDEKNKIVGVFGYSSEISDLIKAEKEIEKQRKELEMIIESSKDIISIFNLNGELLFYNEAFVSMTGYSKKEVEDREFEKDITFYNRAKIKMMFTQFLEKGIYKNVKKKFRGKNGKILHLNMTLSFMPDKERILVIGRDITEEAKKERYYKEYTDLVNNHVIYTITDINEMLTYVSKAFTEISGYTKEDVIGKKHTIFMHEDMSEIVYNDVKKTVSEDKEWFGEIKHKRKDGSVFWLKVIVSPMFDEFGKKTGYMSISQDITDKKLVEEKTEEQNSLLTLFDYGDIVLFRWKNDKNWSIEYVSENVEKIFGYTKEEFLNLEVVFEDCIYHDDIEIVKEYIMHAKTREENFYKHEPYRIVTKNGEIKWILDNTIIQRGKNNNIEHYIGYIIDITDQENSLRNLEKFIDSQNNIVILTDGKEITFANREFYKFFGYRDLKSFRSKHECLSELFSMNDRFFNVSKIEDGKSWIDEIQKLPVSQRIVLINRNGREEQFFMVNVNVYDENLKNVSFSNISQTIFEQLKLEEMTIHDKLTKAYNREFFERNNKRLISEFSDNGYMLGLAVLDIDYFKNVNDTYGHEMGDIVLKEFVNVIKKFSRSEDILIRWGGEEFLLVLKVKSQDDLKIILEKLREKIELNKYSIKDKVTCSLGGTIYNEKDSIEMTIRRADDAMYKSKNEGRNRVTIQM